MEAHGAFTVAAAVMSQEMLEQALSYPKQSVALDMSFQNIMSVEVPKYTFRTQNDDPSEIFPYGFAQTSGELDDALEALSAVFQDMLRAGPGGKDHASFWQLKSKRPAAASMPWNMS